jgi:hypothetical protein
VSEPVPEQFRCRCGGDVEGQRCLLRATQEDMLCDLCRGLNNGRDCVLVNLGPQVSKSGEWEYIGHAGPFSLEPIAFDITEWPPHPSSLSFNTPLQSPNTAIALGQRDT